MANNKLYENYLMHYRTKGSKNGYTKYPDKYTPIGEKAIEAIDSTGLNFNRYKNLQRFWTPKDGGEGPAMVADKAQVAVARAEHDRNNRRAEARKMMSPVLNGVRAATMVGTSGYVKGKNEQNKRKQNQQAAEDRRIAGGRTYGTGTSISRETDRFNKIHEGSSKLYNAAVYTRNVAKEATKPPKAAQEAEARRIKGGNPYVNQRDENRKAAEQRRIAGGSGISASQRQKEAEARRIAGGNPYVNQREENRKNINDWYSGQVRGGNQSAAEARRIKGGSQGTITRAEAARRANQQAAEQRRIAGGSGISASQRQKEAEARRIAGGSQGTITRAEAARRANQQAAESKRKNINDWYSGQVRGGNQSAAEARRIKGGSQGATTTTQAAAKNAESERKKKKLKGVLKALLKSKSHGISRLF